MSSNWLAAFTVLIPMNSSIFYWNGRLAIAKSSALHVPFPPLTYNIIIFTYQNVWKTEHHMTITTAFTSCQCHQQDGYYKDSHKRASDSHRSPRNSPHGCRLKCERRRRWPELKRTSRVRLVITWIQILRGLRLGLRRKLWEMSVQGVDNLENLGRRQLQQLCKSFGIKANKKVRVPWAGQLKRLYWVLLSTECAPQCTIF